MKSHTVPVMVITNTRSSYIHAEIADPADFFGQPTDVVHCVLCVCMCVNNERLLPMHLI